MLKNDPSMLILLVTLTVASSALVGLVAVWAACGKKPHWSVRCGLLLGMISLGLLIPAHELVAMFFVQSMVVVGLLAVYGMFQKRPDGSRRGFQFSLLDMLLFTGLSALVMTIVCASPEGTWTQSKSWFNTCYHYNAAGVFSLTSPHEVTFYLSFGVLFGLATLLGCWVVLAKRRLWVRLPMLLLVFAIAAMSHFFQIAPASYWPYIPAASAVVISAWLFLTRGLGSDAEQLTAEHANKKHLGRWACRFGWVALSLAIVIPPVGLLYFMATPPPIPQVTLPEPNGYDTFVRVGKELQVITVPNISMPGTFTKQSLAAFEQKTDTLFEQAHKALRQECQVPMVYDDTGFDSLLSRVQAIRDLARGFAAQGDIAHMNGDDTKAVACHLDAARLGKASVRGGAYHEALVGITCEAIGLYRLHGLLDSLSDEQLSELAEKLRPMQDFGESLESIAIRDEILMYYFTGWEGRLQLLITNLAPQNKQDILEAILNCFDRRQTLYRMLLMKIALTQYRNKHGEYPKGLDELVPEFLDELPEEPFGADGFVYRLKKAKPGAAGKPGYEIYSPGLNRKDDGGGPTAAGAYVDDVGFW